MNQHTLNEDAIKAGKDRVTDTMVIATTMQALAAAGLEPSAVKGHHHVMLPPGYKMEVITDHIERAQPTPLRKKGTQIVKDVASLIAYCKDMGVKDLAYIYADPDQLALTAVFNDHRAASAGWRDHRAVMKCEYTPEYQRWKNNSGQLMDQVKFAEFVEDNLADIHGPAATTLLDVATTLQAKTGISFSSAKRLDNGQNQLLYSEAITATAGAQGELQIPRDFSIALRIFKNGEGFIIRARLKYRLQQGGVKFMYELDRPEKSVEAAFAGYVDKVRADSEYTVLLGSP